MKDKIIKEGEMFKNIVEILTQRKIEKVISVTTYFNNEEETLDICYVCNGVEETFAVCPIIKK